MKKKITETHVVRIVLQDDVANYIDGWIDDLPNLEAAKELFKELTLVANNFKYCTTSEEN